jgi:hypothetical protein
MDTSLEKLKEIYIDMLRRTGRAGIEELIKYLEESDFFVAPASTQFHGSYPGGLLEHSLNVYNGLVFEYENLKDSGFNLPEIPEESLVLVALLHDLCKVNSYVESTRNVKNEKTGQWEKVPYYKREPKFPMGHGGKSVFVAQSFIKLEAFEAQAIFWHMGFCDISDYMTKNEVSASFEMNLLAFLLHQADMKATYIMENENYNN